MRHNIITDFLLNKFKETYQVMWGSISATDQGESEKYMAGRKCIFWNLSGKSFPGNITRYYPQKHLSQNPKSAVFDLASIFHTHPNIP
jgi:hypothetical protein